MNFRRLNKNLIYASEVALKDGTGLITLYQPGQYMHFTGKVVVGAPAENTMEFSVHDNEGNYLKTILLTPHQVTLLHEAKYDEKEG